MAGSSREARRANGAVGLDRWRVSGLRMTALAAVLAVAACSAVYRNHGYVPEPQDLALVEVGKDTRETVAEKIGRPSAQGLLNDVGWFYVQSRFKHFGPREPQEIDRQVVAVTFTESGVVSDIGRYGLEDGQVVAISRRVTDTNIKASGFIRQLLSNVGRISLDQFGVD